MKYYNYSNNKKLVYFTSKRGLVNVWSLGYCLLNQYMKIYVVDRPALRNIDTYKLITLV